jgi:hypothetical protein
MHSGVRSLRTVDAVAEFEVAMETALANIPNGRIRIILQMAAASVRPDDIYEMFKNRPDLADRAANTPEFERVIRQMVVVARQMVALDLDRSTPQRILGIGRTAVVALFCAKALGHDVTAACRPHLSKIRALKLFQVPCFEQKKPTDLPEGPFDLVICDGNRTLATMGMWADFVLPLADRLSAEGNIFVKLAREGNQKTAYKPEAALAEFKRVGAKISSKNYFVLIRKSLISKLEAQPGSENFDELVQLDPDETRLAADLPADEPVQDKAAAAEAAPVAAEHVGPGERASVRATALQRWRSYWKLGLVLTGGAAVTICALLSSRAH